MFFEGLLIPALEHIYDLEQSSDLLLPPSLTSLYGRLSFPAHTGLPYVISNFVSTLDGVVSVDVPGQAVVEFISGFNLQDSMVMGLLRAVADFVIVGAGTLRASPCHIWTAEYIFPPCAADYRVLRNRMGRPSSPLNVIVTGQGNVDVSLPVFRSDTVSVLIVTTAAGARHINTLQLPKSVQVITGGGGTSLTARGILGAIAAASPSSRLMLVEGGPHLMGNFLAERCLDELFLTLAPQVAGRDKSHERMGIVAERLFAPEHPAWGTLVSVKRGGSHLFLRYAFSGQEKTGGTIPAPDHVSSPPSISG